MNKIKIREFQWDAINKLSDHARNLLDRGQKGKIFFSSPTGSGKTIMLSEVIKNLKREYRENIGFVWLTPARGGLAIQSKDYIEARLENVMTTEYLENIVRMEAFPENTIAFFNWEKFRKGSKLKTEQTEETDFRGFWEKTKRMMVAIIDEEHYNKTKQAQELIDLIQADVEIRVSATLKIREWVEKTAPLVQINAAAVIEEQLIRKAFIINEQIPEITESAELNGHEVLLKTGIKKQQELTKAYEKIGAKVNPLIVVQLPDLKKDEEQLTLKSVKQWLWKHYDLSVENRLVAVHLEEEKENIGTEKGKDMKKIADNQALPIIIITKQAIVQGWDCPRAQILVKFRQSSARFNTQSLGRIRRVSEPNRGYYANEILNNAYVYTLDKKIVNSEENEGLLHIKKILTLKDIENKVIINQTGDIDRKFDRQEEFVAPDFFQWYNERQNEFFTKNNPEIIRQDLIKHFGPVDATNIKIIIIDGVIAGNYEKVDLKTRPITIEIKGDKGLEFVKSIVVKEVIHKLKRIINMPAKDVMNMLEMLLNRELVLQKQVSNYFYDFRLYVEKNQKERWKNAVKYYCFLYASRKKWEELFKDFYREKEVKTNKRRDEAIDKSPNTMFQFTQKKEYKFLIEEQIPKPDEYLADNLAEKNVYERFPKAGVINNFSQPESWFVAELETNRDVEWWYRNETSREDWKIIYVNKNNCQALFYPDFIVKIKGQVWIMEVKDTSGIDDNVVHKFRYLQRYCLKHNLHFGFVLKRSKSNQIVFNNEKWVDDGFAPVWKTWTEFFDK